jgi:DNA primase
MATSPGNWVDFKEIRNQVSIEDALGFLGITNLARQGDALVGPCPVHGGSNPRSFRVDANKNVWFCFSGCRKGGNQLDLVAAVRDISIREAALLLKHELVEPRGGSPPARSGPAPVAANKVVVHTRAGAEPETAPPENPVIDVQLALRGDHPYLAERGLSPETVAHFGVGYCSRGILRGTIAIPIHNARGGLVAYAGRRLRPQEVREYGKYKLPKGFHKDLELYNLHRARPAVLELGFVILVEGFFSAMLLTERGFPNVVASMGASLSQHQSDLLARAPEVVVLYDGDQAGRTGADRAFDDLIERTLVRLVELPDGFEPELLRTETLDWLIAGLRAFDFDRVGLSLRGLVAADDEPAS